MKDRESTFRDYLSNKKRKYSEQSCWDPAVNQGGRDPSKKFLGEYAALWKIIVNDQQTLKKKQSFMMQWLSYV